MYDYTREIDSGSDRQEPIDPNRVTLFEKWASLAALDTHSAMPHMTEFVARVGPMRGKRGNQNRDRGVLSFILAVWQREALSRVRFRPWRGWRRWSGKAALYHKAFGGNAACPG